VPSKFQGARFLSLIGTTWRIFSNVPHRGHSKKQVAVVRKARRLIGVACVHNASSSAGRRDVDGAIQPSISSVPTIFMLSGDWLADFKSAAVISLTFRSADSESMAADPSIPCESRGTERALFPYSKITQSSSIARYRYMVTKSTFFVIIRCTIGSSEPDIAVGRKLRAKAASLTRCEALHA